MKLTRTKASELGKKSSRKGIPNKSTTEIRNAFSNLVVANLDQLEDDIKSLEPIQRLNMIATFAKFILPTLKSIDVQNDTTDIFEPVIIQFTNRNEDTTQ
jgi:hypothetical protein